MLTQAKKKIENVGIFIKVIILCFISKLLNRIKWKKTNKKDDEEEDDDDKGEKESNKAKKEKDAAAELLTRATRGAVLQNKTRGVRIWFSFKNK